MASHTHYFTLERDVDGETVEYELEVECCIEPFVRGYYSGPPENCYPDDGGFAEIDSPVYVLDEDGKRSLWEGSLTKAETAKVEEDAYENWVNNIDDPDPDVDEEVGHYDSYDPEDRMFRTANGGKVYY
jgi:hypothetical protein